MSLAGRRRGVGALLIGLALWPFAHAIGVARYEIDAWKFFGWAMYAVPPIVATESSVKARTGRDWRTVDDSHLTRSEGAALNRFLVRHRALGRLERPDRFARAYLARRTDIDELLVEVSLTRLDRKSGRLMLQPRHFLYKR